MENSQDRNLKVLLVPFQLLLLHNTINHLNRFETGSARFALVYTDFILTYHHQHVLFYGDDDLHTMLSEPACECVCVYAAKVLTISCISEEFGFLQMLDRRPKRLYHLCIVFLLPKNDRTHEGKRKKYYAQNNRSNFFFFSLLLPCNSVHSLVYKASVQKMTCK